MVVNYGYPDGTFLYRGGIDDVNSDYSESARPWRATAYYLLGLFPARLAGDRVGRDTGTPRRHQPQPPGLGGLEVFRIALILLLLLHILLLLLFSLFLRLPPHIRNVIMNNNYECPLSTGAFVTHAGTLETIGKYIIIGQMVPTYCINVRYIFLFTRISPVVHSWFGGRSLKKN